jgi:hypothetical protein
MKALDSKGPYVVVSLHLSRLLTEIYLVSELDVATFHTNLYNVNFGTV